MSKIFDALNKNSPDSLVEPLLLSEVVESVAPVALENGDAELAVNGAELALLALEEPIESRPGGPRTVALNISALSPIFPLDEAQPQASEQYRIIRTKILQHPLQPRTILISSPSSGDGKTVTAINTAACLALRPDTSVLLMDADLRRPSIASLLGLPVSPGLADVLAGRCSLGDAVMCAEQFPNLHVLAAGERTQNPAELLDSSRWGEVMDECRREYRYVILDVTPVAAVADYALVQAACDGVLLVVRQDHTQRALLNNAVRVVPKEKLLGTVLNCVTSWFLWKTHGYGYYRAKK
jgi:protein-tyrosine kinase